MCLDNPANGDKTPRFPVNFAFNSLRFGMWAKCMWKFKQET